MIYLILVDGKAIAAFEQEAVAAFVANIIGKIPANVTVSAVEIFRQ